jgi:iron complex outermembrane receptor protein
MRRSVSTSFLVLIARSALSMADESHLSDLDLDTLMTMDVTVTSAARRAQTSSDAAAAVFVLTRDDIRRSGATSIPELLRMVPGIEVAQISSSSWAVTARGFNSRYATKLLVLIDGRTIYTPINSGVKWEEQYEPIEEIERIEVVRGPGGALWGANAVNAVINIITRSAADAHGVHATLGSGDERRAAAHVSTGATAGRLGDYRVYFDQFQQNSLNAGDRSWRRQQAGARLDTAAGAGSLTFQGEAFRNDLDNIYSAPSTVVALIGGAPLDLEQNGGNLSARWTAPRPAGGQFDVMTDYSWRVNHQLGVDSERESTFNLDGQYAALRAGRHLATFGASIRRVRDDLLANYAATYDPARTARDQWAVYAQDEVYFRGDDLRFTFGAKLEHFATTGTAFEPTVRALWHFSPTQTLWAAWSRAVRTPSRFERDLALAEAQVPGNPPVVVEIFGNSMVGVESVRATELGWRWRPLEQWSVDFSLYRQHYSDTIDLLAIDAVFEPGPPAFILATNRYGNAGSASSRGADAVLEWSARPWLHFQATGSWLHLDTPATGSAFAAPIGVDPSHEVSLRTRVDPTASTELDFRWRRVGKLSGVGIPAYDSVDLRLGWRLAARYDLSASVENLFDHRHVEAFDPALSVPGNIIGRSFFVRAGLRFGE